jgi:hypothetical protein
MGGSLSREDIQRFRWSCSNSVSIGSAGLLEPVTAVRLKSLLGGPALLRMNLRGYAQTTSKEMVRFG